MPPATMTSCFPTRGHNRNRNYDCGGNSRSIRTQTTSAIFSPRIAHPVFKRMCRSIGTSIVSRFMGQLMTVPSVRVSGSRGLNGIVLMPPSPSGVHQDDARQKYDFTIKLWLKAQLRFHNFIIPRDGSTRRFQVRARLRGRARPCAPPIRPLEDIRRRCGRSFASLACRSRSLLSARDSQRGVRPKSLRSVVEQFAQSPHRKGLRFVHGRVRPVLSVDPLFETLSKDRAAAAARVSPSRRLPRLCGFPGFGQHGAPSGQIPSARLRDG
jgi:hypothetical protein